MALWWYIFVRYEGTCRSTIRSPTHLKWNMSLKTRIITGLETSIIKHKQRVEELTTSCRKHTLPYDSDACPCQGELFWKLDRLDESIYRLKILRHSVLRWYLWYLWSSTKSPWFPEESIRVWNQTGQPIAAWQKYGVAQWNGEAFIYYKGSREVSERPAAARSSEWAIFTVPAFLVYNVKKPFSKVGFLKNSQFPLY